MPADYKATASIYEVNLRQYTADGTFRSFAAHLPRLRDMGVQILWLMPVTPISKKGRKGSLGSPYAAQCYTETSPEFGTQDDFKALVQQAHALDFRIIIDWVANHTGRDHVWTETDPHFYKRGEEGGFQSPEGMADIIELDFSNAEMRRAMVDAMKFWVQNFDIDGFRCDLAAWVPLDFWAQAREELEASKPLFFIGEFDELENPGYGEVFDASYPWLWMHRTEAFCKGEATLEELKELLVRYSELGNGSMRAWFTANHDENTWNGTEYEKYGLLAKPLAVFSATWNGVPLIYSGQELPNLRRLQFFEKDVIDWQSPCRLADFYKTLFALKARNSALWGGDAGVSTKFVPTTADQNILAYVRTKGKDAVLVVLNMCRGTVDFRLAQHIEGDFRDVFSSESIPLSDVLTLQPGSFLLLEKQLSAETGFPCP